MADPAAVRASAPGKALLLGEYAVLYRHPAIVQSIDRRVYCTIEASESREHRLLAIPLHHEAAAFRFENGCLRWLDPVFEQRLPLIAPLFNLLGTREQAALATDTALRITIDSSEFFHPDGTKLGLGSSAAMTVAVVRAWYRWRYPHSVLDSRLWLDNLIRLHRRLQHGHGSGADIAASLLGGLLEFCLPTADDQHGKVTATTLQWPEQLELIWIWLGRPASTRHMIEDVETFRCERPADHGGHIEHLGELSRQGAAAIRNRDAEQLKQTIAAYGRAMQAFGEAAGAAIWTDDHRRLAALAADSGIAFKPSGAGGGDIAIAASTDTLALADYARRCRAAGYTILPLRPAPPESEH